MPRLSAPDPTAERTLPRTHPPRPEAAPHLRQRPLTAAPHPGHAGFHPVAWCQYYDGGRAWLSTLGHNTHSFAADLSGPGAEAFQRLVVQGVKSAMGLIPFCTAE